MNSQEDLFAPDKPKYTFLVLCDKDQNNMSPFAAYPRSIFSNKEIQDRWMDSILDNISRLKTLNSLQIPDKHFSLFGKIDSGN